MTVQARLIPIEGEDAWDAAASAANSWRGQAIQIFAQAEWAVSETLERLVMYSRSGSNVRLRRLVGQRFEDLDTALAEHFAGDAKKASEALAKFRRHEHLRPALCHGVSKLALDRNGNWLIILKLVVFRGRAVERTAQTIEQKDAETLLKSLRDDARELASALQSLRSKLGDPRK